MIFVQFLRQAIAAACPWTPRLLGAQLLVERATESVGQTAGKGTSRLGVFLQWTRVTILGG